MLQIQFRRAKPVVGFVVSRVFRNRLLELHNASRRILLSHLPHPLCKCTSRLAGNLQFPHGYRITRSVRVARSQAMVPDLRRTQGWEKKGRQDGGQNSESHRSTSKREAIAPASQVA